MADTLRTSIRIEVLDAFSAPLRRMREQLGTVRKSLKDASEGFKLAGDLRNAADAAGRFSAALAGAIKGPTDEFKNFEQEMSAVAAISGEVGTEAFGKLREQALELGASTSFTAQQAAAAMKEFAVAGRSANEILAVTPLTLSLARASGSDLARTAEILGSSMSGMGLDASQSARAADVLTTAFSSSATTLESLGESFKYVAPVAKQANVSIETAAALIGVLGNAGIRGSEAGTGLRAVFVRLLGPMRRATKEFEEIGIKGAKLKELQQALAQGNVEKALSGIAEATSKLPNEERIAALTRIFGQEALTTASVLIDANLDTGDKGLAALKGKLQAAEGSARRLATVMEDNLAGELTRTGSAISGLSIQIGEQLKPTIMAMAGAVQRLVAGTSKWVEANPELANALARLAILAAGGGFALKGFLMTLSVATSSFAVARKVLGGLHAAYIAVRGVTVALSGSMYAALIPAFIQTKIAALGAAFASAGLATKILAGTGLVAAAGAAGYAIGRWADETWGLSEKMTRAIDAIATSVLWLPSAYTEKTDKRGTQAGAPRVYADGTVADSSGKIVSLGTGPASAAPNVVREARAVGRGATLADINAFAEERRAKAFEGGTAAPVPLPGGSAGPASPVGGGGSGDAATREQTQRLERASRDQERLLRELVDETKKSNRRRPASTGSTEGAY